MHDVDEFTILFLITQWEITSSVQDATNAAAMARDKLMERGEKLQVRVILVRGSFSALQFSSHTCFLCVDYVQVSSN